MIEIDKIYNEDCLIGMQRIPDGSVDLIVTDPPYDVMTTGGGGSVNNVKKLDKSLKQLDNAGISNGYDIEKFAEMVKKIQKGNINLYIWCNKVQLPRYFSTYVDTLKCKFDIICWHKLNALPTYSNKYLSDTEYCLYFHKNGLCKPRDYKDAQTFEISYINHEDKKLWEHPTIKPLDIICKLIRNSSNIGDTILDPFMGSGTTAIACIKEKRHFIGFELDKNYYDLATKRINAEQSQLTLDLF